MAVDSISRARMCFRNAHMLQTKCGARNAGWPSAWETRRDGTGREGKKEKAGAEGRIKRVIQ